MNNLSIQNDRLSYALIILCVLIVSCGKPVQEEKEIGDEKTFGEIAMEESLVPIHQGKPGETPFWNKYSKRFIYAPAFNYDNVKGAAKYRYEILSLKDSGTYSFESDTPYAPLSPVWAKMPVSPFKIKVIGISQQGDSLGLAGKGQYYHAAPFAGIYHKPVLPYDSSAMIALEHLMHEDYVNYWLTNKSPDPDYKYYRYPTKILGALIVGAVTYARLKPNTAEAERSTKLARIVADYLLDISDPEGRPLEYFPPSYHGYDEVFDKKPNSHMQHENTMIPYAADAGNAYLDLYDLTKDEKYLEAAKQIARTYLKTQLDNGSWYLYVNNITGEPIAENITIPTSTINYLDRLRKDYRMEGLEKATKAAFEWIMENPVNTFNWQGQFEDVAASKPYKNHSREQACDLAVYLFKNNKNIALAEELVRFSEDQFVIWENPMDTAIRSSGPGYSSKNWITPSVQEQYKYWMPVSRSAGIMIDTYWNAYKATDKKIYLAKAKSIANAFTVVQKAHNGDYPTYFTKYPLGVWLNNTIYPAKVMMTLKHNLEKSEK